MHVVLLKLNDSLISSGSGICEHHRTHKMATT